MTNALKMFATALLSASIAFGQASQPTAEKPQGRPGETKAQRDARMAWWRAARFGMFIHWGIYSVPAGTTNDGRRIEGLGEWIMNRGHIPVAEYAAYAKRFNPVKYDPDAWVRMAKDAGMKYIVITSKHHDGFALFDSKVTDYDVVDATPYGKDLLKPLAEACRKQGMKLGFYYSQAQDWHHPGGAAMREGHWDPAQEGDMDEYLRKIAVPQVTEILTNYGDVAVLWWDTPMNMTMERAELFLPLLKLQPNIIVNNRLGAGIPGDTETPEQYIPATGFPGRDWETCMTMNDTWGFKSYDENWKSADTLVHNLIDAASKGGNYLLNVGPTSEGEIPLQSIERLKAIGDWMNVNGDAIYGTTASPFKKYTFDGRCTVKGDKMYVHVFKWPAEGVKLTGLKTPVKSGRFLDGGETASIESSPLVTIKLPAAKPADALATVVELQLDGKPQVDPNTFAVRPDANGALTLGAAEAFIMGRRIKLEDKDGAQRIGNWTDRRDFVMWDVMVPAAGEYTVELNYARPEPASDVEMQLSVGEKGETKTAGKLAGTGGWDQYKAAPLGKITLPQGTHSLALRPTTMPSSESALNLKEVRLTPAK